MSNGRLVLLDGRTGAVESEEEFLPDLNLSVAAFHREHQLVVGTASRGADPYGARVFDTQSGEVIAKLQMFDPFGGATVQHIHSNPGAGLVC